MRLWGWWRQDCGHRCCPIRDNPYHYHLHWPRPETCPYCIALAQQEQTA